MAGILNNSFGAPTMASVLISTFISTTDITGRLAGVRVGTSVRRSYKLHRATAAASQRVSFQSSVHTDLLLRGFRTVSFEQYMEDEDRVFKAVFPDTRRRQKLNDEEWRIFMLPLEFIFLSVRPVVDMRITLKEPTKATVGSSRTVSRLLTLEATRWELRGLEHMVNPSDFNLGVVGSLYPEKGGPSPRLKGQMKLSVDLVIPPSLGLMPPVVIEGFGQALLSQLLENMKERVNTRLLQDYKEYAEQQGRHCLG